MCNACNNSPHYNDLAGFTHIRMLADIKRACREGMKVGPTRWQAPPRSDKAELSYQLRRLAGNAVYETECEVSNV